MTSAAPVEPTTVRDLFKADRVYQALRRRIRDLELPPGAPLRKDELAAEFNVSRAPISEAIARLADQGLVDVFPQHGSFVAEIRASDVREGLFIRTGLEIEAARAAAQMADPVLLAPLDDNIAAQTQALQADDLAHFYELDEAMHAAIFSAVGRMAGPSGFWSRPAHRWTGMRKIVLPQPGRPEGTLAEHRRLVEAIRMGDPDFAAAATRSHLAAVTEAVERQLAPGWTGIGAS